jgi:small GTP-binding protein
VKILNRAQKILSKWFSNSAKKIEDGFNMASNSLIEANQSQGKAALDSLSNFLRWLIIFISSVWVKIVACGQKIILKWYSNSAQKIEVGLIVAKRSLSEAKNSLIKVKTSLNEVKGRLNGVKDSLSEAKNGLNEVKDQLSEAVTGGFSYLRDKFNEKMQQNDQLADSYPHQELQQDLQQNQQINSTEGQNSQFSGDQHLSIARESLSYLLNDKRVPPEVRESLQEDFKQVEKMLEKIEHEQVHISVLGRVSVGKSSLLNTLIGKSLFSSSPLHGETKKTAYVNWQEYEDGGVYFIDTPGINEIDGENRAKLAHEVAGRSDVILFVIDGDITDTEYQALNSVVSESKPVVLVLNKVDRYTQDEKKVLMDTISDRVAGLVEKKNIVTAVSRESTKHYILVDEQGNETETIRDFPAEVDTLKECLWDILQSEGKTLSALNASLFADELSDQMTERVMSIRKDVAEKLIRAYCISKGVAVAINPIPIADLMAAAIVDVTMIVHLSRLYGLPLTKKEAGSLVTTIMSQIILLMGTIWAMYFVSSALKLGTGGLSIALTASAQGAVAYFSTLIVGQAAQEYLRQGKSWGENGAKNAVQSILDSLDRDCILEQAKDDIMNRLKSGA